MFAIRYQRFFLPIAAVLVAASLACVIFFGFNLGLDFTGGSLVAVTYPSGRPDMTGTRSLLVARGFEDAVLQPWGEQGYIIRTRVLSGVERLPLLDALSHGGEFDLVEERFSSIGPSIGRELRRKSLVAIALVVLSILCFIAFAFRKVKKTGERTEQQGVGSWTYGLVAIITLFHDVAIPAGVFAVLGRTAGVEVDVLFVTALLTIFGYSVNDTIVIFDRIRENLARNREQGKKHDFRSVVGAGLEETYVRSVNTALTVVFVLVALLVVGSESTRLFSLALLIGVVAGTYSSIFVASPLLVFFAERRKR